MSPLVFDGSADITTQGIKKHFEKFKPWHVLFELVWNGLDAMATRVDIKLRKDALDGLQIVEVVDNGVGIDFRNIENNFRKFNESLKVGAGQHGSHGRGRLAFHVLASNAVWYTKHNSENAKISIESPSIKDYRGKILTEEQQHEMIAKIKNGTAVRLSKCYNNLPDDKDLSKKLGLEFGWFLSLNKKCKIFLNDKSIKIPSHVFYKYKKTIDGVAFSINVIRWETKPASEKSFNYLIGSDLRVAHKELSGFNKKNRFWVSTYTFSEWVDEFKTKAPSLDNVDYTTESIVYKKLVRTINLKINKIYEDYLRSSIEDELDGFEKRNIIPTYEGERPEYAEWRKENTKSLVRKIYYADPTIFNSLKEKQLKIIVRLLDKISISCDNDSLFDVLESVLELEPEKMKALSMQISKSKLEYIVSTIEVLQKRQTAIHKLREIMEHRFSEVLETPDLQKIIENNTWLFGAQYATLGAEEDTFQAIAKKLRSQINDIDVISDDDISDGATVEGVNRQVDLFLSRKVPVHDSQGNPSYKCVIIEIKRPGISLNKKHLQQIDDYTEIIAKHDAFGSDRMKFELILVGRKISRDDFRIRQRMDGLKDKGEYGLVSYTPIKCYVKDWFTIFDEFDLMNAYLIDNLHTKLESFSESSTERLVKDLQSKTK
jgi:hypothetical protein